MSKRNIGKCQVIGLVVNTFIKPNRDVMLGWMRYGRKRSDIELRFFFASMVTSAENLLAFASSGIDTLVLCGLQEETVADFLKSNRPNMPVVVCGHALSGNDIDLNILPNVGVVLADSESIGRHVGEFFLEHGLDNFAFMGINLKSERIYCQARCAAFRAAVMANANDDGKTFKAKTFGVSMDNGDFWDQPRKAILSWVRSLDLPCGVFVNGDRSAAVLVDACSRLGIGIPDQIEVVSVNNSYGICESMGTTISSIQPDFDKCARQSIELALKMIAADASGLTVGDRTIVVSDHLLIERSSSLSGRRHGRIVTRAKEFIKNNACNGISVVDVAKHLGVSRRTLEISIRYATGNSVLGLIRNARLRNICRLLVNSDLSLSAIITQSGYSISGNVAVAFKKMYGMSMRQYRLSHGRKTHPAHKEL